MSWSNSTGVISEPKKKELSSLDEVDPQLLETYNKLGIPLEEQKVLAGVAVDVVFDSIRHPDEASFLKEKGVFLVGIQANQQERYDRISKRKHGTDFVDLSTFIYQDTNELKGTNKGQDIEACYQFCDLVVTNDRSLDHFISD